MNNRIIYITVLFLLLGLAGYSQVYNINQITAPVTTCNATLYDSGGPNGQYSDGENYTVTFCGAAGAPIIVEVVSLRTESVSFDYLKIYDGDNTGATLMATLGGTSMPQQTEYEASGNCITIYWHSDGSVHSYDGFVVICLMI